MFWRTASTDSFTASVVRARMCSRTVSGLRSIPVPYRSRRRNPVRYRAASRRVFVGTPVLLAAEPPGSALRSTMATRLPKYAAWAPAFSPAGPAPITTRSNGSDVTVAQDTTLTVVAPGDALRGVGVIELGYPPRID